MFKKIIRRDRKTDISCGSTSVPAERTEAEIKKLLKKHECEKILMMEERDGHQHIAFELQGKSYHFIVPRVYIKDVYQERIGIRLVFHLLKPILEFVQEGLISPDIALLPARMVIDKKTGEMTNMADYILPELEKEQVKLLPPITTKNKNNCEDQ